MMMKWDAFEGSHTRTRYLKVIQSNDVDQYEQTKQWQTGYVKWGMKTMGFCFLILQKSPF